MIVLLYISNVLKNTRMYFLLSYSFQKRVIFRDIIVYKLFSMFKLATALLKKSLKISDISLPSSITTLRPIKVIFWLVVTFSENIDSLPKYFVVTDNKRI